MVFTSTKMYTVKKRHVLRRCLFRLSHGMDHDKVKNLITILSKAGVFVQFDYGSFCYGEIDDLINHLCMYCVASAFRSNDYGEVVKYTSEKYNEQSVVVHVPFKSDISYVRYKQMGQMTMDQYNMITYMMNEVNPRSVVCELYCDRDNIFSLNESIKMFSERNISSEVFFCDYPRSGNYTSDNYSHMNKCVKHDINYRLILDNVISNKNTKISNRDCLDYMYERCLKDNFRCDQNKDMFNLVVDSDFKIRLCDHIRGRKCCVDPFDCIDSNGNVKDEFMELFKQDYNELCYGCNCCQFIQYMMERN